MAKTAHQDVAGVVEKLRWLSSPDAERMSDYQRINNFVASGVESADLIESLSKALSEAEAERDYQTGFVQKLQTALAFWMPGVDLRLDEATRELAADDAYLLAGSTGERDLPCWGEGILERALAAESRLAEAMNHLRAMHRYASRSEAGPEIDAARAFLNAGKE